MPSSWFAPIDAYCERLDASFWAEPLNAVSNAAFFLAAIAALALLRGKDPGGKPDRAGQLLIALTLLIGTGSFLFHTLANRWSALADVIPIGVFILVYFCIAMRRFLGLRLGWALAATAAFQGLALVITQLWRDAVVTPLGWDPINGSAGYLSAFLAILGVGLAALPRDRATARRLLVAGGVFALSLTCRALDARICGAVPFGSHFLWHILNGTLLFLLMRAVILRGTAGIGGRSMSLPA